jgi:hypothetical protein
MAALDHSIHVSMALCSEVLELTAQTIREHCADVLEDAVWLQILVAMRL